MDPVNNSIANNSFSARRPAAGALPTFSLPPPQSEVPRTSDGLSPSLSSVHTNSSQGSQAPANMQYTYSSQVQGSWPTPGGSSYSIGSGSSAQQPLAQTPGGSSYGSSTNGTQQPMGQQPPYTGRGSIYSQSSMSYGSQRNSQSPATGGEGLPAPPYDQVHHQFQPSNGHENHSSLQSGTMLPAHSSTQPPPPASAPAHVDTYGHGRPAGAAPNYTPSYATQHSPTTHSPTNNGTIPRGLGPLSNQAPSSMAPPVHYRTYSSYPQLPTMSGPVMSNIHQPGGQLSMIPGMVPPGYGPQHAMMYSHPQPQPQSERPFKCDQCVQSFSRNHDLKRHKRIHLAVKPFPCTYCSKSFSRKDALKRHRLVKGCESKGHENSVPLEEGNQGSRNSEAGEDGARKTP